MRRATVLWTALAVAGVLLVAGVTYAASQLSTQTIGLSSEPLSAGSELAPRATPTATPVPPAATDDDAVEDSSGSGGDDDSGQGRGRGRGRGRGGDDDD